MSDGGSRALMVYLCGFMGVGKSTVGPLLAKTMGLEYLDTDQLIVKKAGKSIPDIFAQDGEAGFRKLEKQVIAEARSGAVVALGGGALMSTDNLVHVRKTGILVYLAADPGELEKRLENTAHARPLLSGLSGSQLRERITGLLHARESVYESADLRVETDGRTPAAVAEEIAARLRGMMQ